ncbi:putative lipoprotein [Vibrio nigripulchritudo SFn27]|uniref:Putative lipoprotein n=1 Tax=Vibrio nigripulchritudo TaxID=28173 RepID=U4JU93_9VIBR|nr:BON domain-containing protein [Vibrio nigripulchritudo]CCN82070.1 putative lipoprotein [Vibrio nigripulchritudo BLFn1]CCN86348.1 putative lipoprotein [Vibrio nigripulchritudo SFn27]CCN96380.1 putative lipoprotein [Vibrio nigripulchritudo ENn2]CCO41976.1 putative lipoprotein [Vibrio nigripulchritudo SFn135]CCO53278.1 putative lipoprotein [Vibrio nigripulchritudo Wn13]
MKKWILAAACSLSLTGCAGLLVAGAATTANIVTDTRTTKEQWQDSQLEFEVAGLGNKAPFTGNVKATATSFRGKVILIGQAVTEEYKQQFGSQVNQVEGVQSVSNQLRVRPLLDLQTITHDSWITTKVKTSLIANEDLTTVKIKVITEDGEVFLLGYVTPEQADLATDIARNISGVKQVIRAFEISQPQVQSQ